MAQDKFSQRTSGDKLRQREWRSELDQPSQCEHRNSPTAGLSAISPRAASGTGGHMPSVASRSPISMSTASRSSTYLLRSAHLCPEPRCVSSGSPNFLASQILTGDISPQQGSAASASVEVGSPPGQVEPGRFRHSANLMLRCVTAIGVGSGRKRFSRGSGGLSVVRKAPATRHESHRPRKDRQRRQCRSLRPIAGSGGCIDAEPQ
jgi:hypothetical protein